MLCLASQLCCEPSKKCIFLRVSMVTSQVLNGVHCERYLTNCFSFQLACGFNTGWKNCWKIHKSTSTKKAEVNKLALKILNKMLSLIQQGTAPWNQPCVFGYIFQKSKRRRMGTRFFPLNLWFTKIQFGLFLHTSASKFLLKVLWKCHLLQHGVFFT